MSSMKRFFNTAGPCNSRDHYMLSVVERMPEILEPIERKLYFILHAPRQVGKTTTLLSLAEELTKSGRYVSALVSMEVGAGFPHDVAKAEGAILDSWQAAIKAQLEPVFYPPPWSPAEPGRRIGMALETWAETASRPLVVFLDEVDALRNSVLISVLRQLRDGYRNRPKHFPHSLALVGLRDIRDYKVREGERDELGTASPFNIKVRSFTLRNFNREEVGKLYEQHTEDTGQIFSQAAKDRAFELTQGQPWLVNALAAEVVDALVQDRTQIITDKDIDRARDILIARQDTHLDSLAERLREKRIQAIIEPMLAGQSLENVPNDDIRFALDLGLVRATTAGGIDIANPIYREIIVRDLFFNRRSSLPQIQPSWLDRQGRLVPQKLLDSFLVFWRRHGEALMQGAAYHEVAPHLVLMAYLDRVVNGGGRVEREYAIGRGRMDVCVEYGDQRLAMELKVWRDRRPDPKAEGLEQLDGYLAGLGLTSGWLIIFDRRSDLPPVEERTRSEAAQSPAGHGITVIYA